MAIQQQNSRLQQHTFTGPGDVASVPAGSEDFTNSNWLDTDLVLYEIGINGNDERIWFRSDFGIVEIATHTNLGIDKVLNVSNELDTGQTLSYDTGNADSTAGTVVLVAGAATVNTTAITSTSIVLLTHQVLGGSIGILYKGTVVAGTSFDIRSSNLSDTSTIGWLIINTH